MEALNAQRFLSLRRMAMEKYFSNMNDKQQHAIFHINGPLLILAGAGSGKTTVLVNRIANMVRFGNAYESKQIPYSADEQSIRLLQDYLDDKISFDDRFISFMAVDPVPCYRIMAITFTNKAANELKERLEKMLGEDAREIVASTFHSACVRILRRGIDRLGYANSFTIYDSDDSLRIIKESLKSLNIDEKMFPPRSVLSQIGRAKDMLLSPQQYADQVGGDYRLQVIAKVYALYQQRLKSADALDFDDIILLTVRLFSEHPDVLAYYQNRYQYIMVDEYQDTNHAQYMLVSLLSKGHENLCVVGDDDQSIYKFRGATIENILSFEDQFSHCDVIRLEQNYRSTQTILDAANAVIAHNTQRKGKNLWTANEAGEKVYVHTTFDEMSEAAFVAQTIERNVLEGAHYSDHAVLYRMNAQSNALEKYFVKAGVPYRIIGGVRFYERKEIKDAISYLSVINNPNDALRLRRIINEPKRGIGEATLAAAERIAQQQEISLFSVLLDAQQYPELSRKARPLMEFAYMMHSLMKLNETATPDVVFEAVLEKSGYMQYLQSLGEEGITRVENIQELTSNLIRYSEDNEEATLSGFLEEVALISDIDNYDTTTDAVIMMTMHSAKGLEFPYVFIVGMEEGIFPGMQSIYNPGEIEEERRLAYVGITRAKKQLYITNVSSRMIFGNTQRNKQSRFVSEIPLELRQIDDKTILRTQMAGKHEKAAADHSGAGKQIGVSAGNTSSTGISALYTPGDRVRHKIFGSGVVTSAQRMGNDTLVEIDFEKVGKKKIMANFAKLEFEP